MDSSIFQAMATAAVFAVLSWPGVTIARAGSDAAGAEQARLAAPGPSCSVAATAQPERPSADVSAFLAELRQRQAARQQPAGFVALNGRGYNYGPPSIDSGLPGVAPVAVPR